MSIPKMTEDLKIIQGLSDLPNSEDGLTAEQLKAKFDYAALAIQAYLNNTLLPALIASKLPFSATTEIDADNIQTAIQNVQSQIRDAATGTIVNGSVTKEKLASGLLARIYGGMPWVSVDTPDGGDNPDTDFPVGQVWLRPGFTVTNEAGETWTGSGCTAEKSGGDVTITGSAQAASVTASQNLTGLGEQGDRVRILFSVENRDSEITAMTASVNGGTAQAISGNVTLEGTLSAGGALSVQFAVTWPSASLADGSVTIGSYTVVNLDKIMRQAIGAKEISDWTDYLWSVLPLTSFRSPEALFIQQTAGNWYQIVFDVLPVSRGGTGLSALAADSYMKTTEDGAVGFRSKAEVIEDLGSLRFQTGTYTGNQAERTITLPVTPKLLVMWPEGGPKKNSFVMQENPIVLCQGAIAKEYYTGLQSNDVSMTYYSSVTLSGKTLKFELEAHSTIVSPSCQYENRSGVVYHWAAIY